jgi:hypothetical protein
MLESQLLQIAFHSQNEHMNCGAKPRLLIKIIACLFLFKILDIASIASGARPLITFVSLISRIENLGGFFLVIRFVNLIIPNFFSSTNFNVLNEGVADPRIIGIFRV